ncbi:HutD family protein [Kitasatospora sp. NPDC058170]|uniref:HutD/Ves family protein n=1 Tax=Kitasatospora sp. NPDC058170 TaxID=3346364 RepID=UPI0036D9CCEA
MTAERIKVLRAAERPATAWLNGGGVTREVAGFPVGAGPADFDWRVSLADVDSAGPFSAFPGIDRVITLVEGAGMALTVDGAEHVIDAPYRPFAFAGDAATDCRLLGGPVVDFNVMTRRGRTTADIALADAPRTVDVAPGTAVLLVCLSGTATVTTATVTTEAVATEAVTTKAGDATALTRFDAALLHGPGTHGLRPEGVTAVLAFRTAAPNDEPSAQPDA